uniref:Uncharacterized protein n=1 Tax=Rhizophora mucronata TaxID=61149 RepID=A0A2P2QP36_RHIMU
MANWIAILETRVGTKQGEVTVKLQERMNQARITKKKKVSKLRERNPAF